MAAFVANGFHLVVSVKDRAVSVTDRAVKATVDAVHTLPKLLFVDPEVKAANRLKRANRVARELRRQARSYRPPMNMLAFKVLSYWSSYTKKTRWDRAQTKADLAEINKRISIAAKEGAWDKRQSQAFKASEGIEGTIERRRNRESQRASMTATGNTPTKGSRLSVRAVEQGIDEKLVSEMNAIVQRDAEKRRLEELAIEEAKRKAAEALAEANKRLDYTLRDELKDVPAKVSKKIRFSYATLKVSEDRDKTGSTDGVASGDESDDVESLALKTTAESKPDAAAASAVQQQTTSASKSDPAVASAVQQENNSRSTPDPAAASAVQPESDSRSNPDAAAASAVQPDLSS